MRHSQHKIIAVIGRRADQSQNFSCEGVHGHAAAFVIFKLPVQHLLKLRVNGRGDIQPVFRLFLRQHRPLLSILVYDGNLATICAAQFILIKTLQPTFSQNAVRVISFAFSFFQIFRRHTLHISGQMGGHFPQRIDSVLSIRHHDARNLHQLFHQLTVEILSQQRVLHCMVLLYLFHGDERIILDPGRIQRILYTLCGYFQKISHFLNIFLPLRRVYAHLSRDQPHR